MEIKLNQWCKYLVYKSVYWYIKINEISIDGCYGIFITHRNEFNSTGGWNFNSLENIEEIESKVVCDLFDTGDHSNIIIAMELLKQKQ